MKNSTILVMLFFILITTCNATSVTITKYNGKVNKDKSVTYSYVNITFKDDKVTVLCKNPGDEKCPAKTDFSINNVGGCNQLVPNPLSDFVICAVEEIVISRILRGETRGDGEYEGGITYSFVDGFIDENGVLSYTFTVSDNK